MRKLDRAKRYMWKLHCGSCLRTSYTNGELDHCPDCGERYYIRTEPPEEPWAQQNNRRETDGLRRH